MAIKKLNPYLNFNGDADQAIELYKRALGAKVENMMRWGEMPGGGDQFPPDEKKRVMHAMLQVGGGELMLADGRPDDPVKPGTNQHVTLHFDDTAEMDKRFNALSEGGKVIMPLEDAFWGDRFGMVTDRFGIQWMFIGPKQKS